MPKYLRFGLIGCGGLLALVILLGIFGAILGNGDSTQELKAPTQQEEPQPEPAKEEPEAPEPEAPEPEAPEPEAPEPEALNMELEITTSGGAGYGGNYRDENGTTTLENTYEDTTHELTAEPGDTVIATVVRLTDPGEVTVTLSHEGETVFEGIAGNDDDTVNLVYDTDDLEN